ncbi:MAG: Amuc_1100 family pilus-like protein [Puniceicoccales bacterium]|nr:Amuc_1100 family pilus-like protein [Puniceicoccales bacterium]
MKKLFFRRHKLFFISLLLLAICEVILAKRCVQYWQKEVMIGEEVKTIDSVLSDKNRALPSEYRLREQVANDDVQKYRNFVANTWLNIARRERDNEMIAQPSTNVALFFEISDFVTQNRELCDSLGISYDQDYSFGFSDYFNKKEQPLSSEILHIHQQKEHIKTVLKYLFESRAIYLHLDSVERGVSETSADSRNSDIFISHEKRIQSEDLQSDVYKFTFESFTSTFRKFLNGLRKGEAPLVVRGIEVEPCKQTYLKKQAQEYLIQGAPSKYTLTVEVLNLPNDLTRRYRRDVRYIRRKAAI